MRRVLVLAVLIAALSLLFVPAASAGWTWDDFSGVAMWSAD